MGGRQPVAGARVRFTADVGGKLAATLVAVAAGTDVFTATAGADGIVACAWLPANDLTRPSQQVEARAYAHHHEPMERFRAREIAGVAAEAFAVLSPEARMPSLPGL